VSGLRLVGLWRRYGDVVAVEDVSLDVADGEFVTLLGPSGCGKTTTLRMVAGFIAPNGGDIFFDDLRMNAVPPHRRNTAMVFQSYALFPHMSVAENVAFGLRMRKLPKAEQAKRVEEALDMVSLRGLERRRPGELSGGQQQRVALARAVATRPDILLFDEPLSNLDAKLREKVRIEIRDLQRRLGITALYVTHDQAEALAISDRIVVMNEGRIEQVGDPNAIYRTPKSSFVADFVGAANIVDAKNLGGGTFDTPIGRFAIPGAACAAGGQVKLSWRPEDMTIAAGGSANIAGARVESVVFRGNFIELVVAVSGQLLRAQVASDVSVKQGDRLDFALPPDRIRIVG
jgi:ABC-type Fe3+/spermidine/putrescine transport system ATPase subunit